MFSKEKTPFSFYEKALQDFEQAINHLAQTQQTLINEISQLQAFKQELKDEMKQEIETAKEDLKKEIDSLVAERLKTVLSNYPNSDKKPSNFW